MVTMIIFDHASHFMFHLPKAFAVDQIKNTKMFLFVACQFLLSFVASRSNNNDTNKYRNNNNICVLSTKRNENIFDIYIYNSNLKRDPFCNDYLQ